MKNNTQGVSRNGNQGGSSQARFESATSGKRLGNLRENAQALGTGTALPSGPSVDHASPNPRCSHDEPASGATSQCASSQAATPNAPQAARPAKRKVGQRRRTSSRAPAHKLEANRRRLARLRARRWKLEEELDGVPINDACLPERVRLCRARAALNQQIEAIEVLGDGGPRLTVTLDDYASALVRRCQRSRSAMNLATDDVAGAALAFMLGEDDDHCTEEELSKATARRLADVASTNVPASRTEEVVA